MKGLSIDSIVDVLKMEPGEVLRILEQAESLTEDLPSSDSKTLRFTFWGLNQPSFQNVTVWKASMWCKRRLIHSYSSLSWGVSQICSICFFFKVFHFYRWVEQILHPKVSPWNKAIQDDAKNLQHNYQVCLNDHTVRQRVRLWTRKVDLGLNSQNLDSQVVMQRSVMWRVVAYCLGCGLLQFSTHSFSPRRVTLRHRSTFFFTKNDSQQTNGQRIGCTAW